MRKIYLVSPSLQENVQFRDVNNSYSLGMGYLHSVIRNAGYDITTVNFNSIDEKVCINTILEHLRTHRPDYLLVQMFTMNRVACYKIIRAAREVHPCAKIIVGGVHATIFPEQILENFDVDVIVVGEGEETIAELLPTMDADRDLASIKGIAYRQGGKIVRTEDQGLIADLDSIPFPAHELFIEPERSMACILTSRGCPFKCNFCCLHTISKRRYRKRSVENIVLEIEQLLRNHPNIKIIQIADDTFTLDMQRTIDFCNEIIRRRVKVEFWCSARIKPASEEMFRLMEQAGFTSVSFGLETGSDKLLEAIHKNITQDDARKVFRMLRDSKIKVSTFLMVGFPGENEESIAETIRFIKELQEIKSYGLVGVAPLWVYPNTEVYDIMKQAGKIDDSYWLTEKDVPYFTVEHTFEELLKMSVRINWYYSPFRQKGTYLILRLRKYFPHIEHYASKACTFLKRAAGHPA